MITFQEEKIADFLGEALPMVEQHWRELANHQDTRPLKPDWETYKKMNELGSVRFITVRLDKVLIGYAVYCIANNLHYSDWKYAACDVYYLHPEFRKQGIGEKFIIAINEWLKTLGVKSTVIQEKIDHPHGDLFTSLGYKLIERHYEKVL